MSPRPRSLFLLIAVSAVLVGLLAPASADDPALAQVDVEVSTPARTAPGGTALSDDLLLAIARPGGTITSYARGDDESLDLVESLDLRSDSLQQVALSADGRAAYVTATRRVFVVKVGRRGGLKLVQTVRNQPHMELGRAFSLAVPPDGKFVYVGGSSTVNIFVRDVRTGRLTFRDLVSGLGTFAPAAMAISPDGRQLYAGECAGNGQLFAFDRNERNGSLHRERRYQVGDGAETCAWGIGVGDDTVVVAGQNEGGVTSFLRDDTGALTQTEVVVDDSLDGARFLVRPDGGQTFFVAAYDSDAVVRLTVLPDGDLALQAATTSDDLDGPFGLSADPTAVYAPGSLSNTIVASRRPD